MKWIVLVDVDLSANGEYESSIDNVFCGIVDADKKEEALKLAEDKFDESFIHSLGRWVCSYGYYFHVIKI